MFKGQWADSTGLEWNVKLIVNTENQQVVGVSITPHAGTVMTYNPVEELWADRQQVLDSLRNI